MPIMMVLIGLVVYVILGVVIIGVVRRLVDRSERHDIDDQFPILVTVWPVFLITFPCLWLYRLIGGR